MRRELPGTQENLVSYWQFNYDLSDETPQDNDLTSISGPPFSTDVPFPFPVPSLSPRSLLLLIVSLLAAGFLPLIGGNREAQP
jgi:hypothetical protein